MKLWLSAAEIAALQLPGLPATKRGVALVAKRNRWSDQPEYCRSSSNRGGGVEYHIHLLPPDARADYVARQIEMVEIPASIARDAAAEPAAAALSGMSTDSRDARLALLTLAERFAADAQLSRKVADAARSRAR